MYGLAGKAEALGVRVLTGVTVTGFDFGHNSEAVAAVETDRGRIACEQIVIGTGPWVRDFWDMLDLPKKIAVKGRDGVLHDDVPMWRYWQLEEGVLGVEPGHLRSEEHTSELQSLMRISYDVICVKKTQ